ncbi:MAG: MarR family transcriptional regulator [Oscillatoriaceae bacterium SKW80]|nr:MarR family transcriptional regulator [Oscillatoriaceae bacterium SKYG93]MCX8122322.1 MarR family transcriptional regulator [Oscillatoriaceae bacterium SKW80]MDW8452536.1 MarR family transcriptional regulator [Oscillatoriaceae cyanobacterium SKYGB_i_bin93]
MDKDRRQFEVKRFIEEVGVLFELTGLPRMAGRILGWLLICNPPHQSTSDLAEVLQASKGSISTMTRLLIQGGLVERISMPGERRDYFCIKLGAWSAMIEQRLAQITAIRQLAERGLEIVKDKEARARLQEMRDFHAFFEREMPALVERWQQEHLNQFQSAADLLPKSPNPGSKNNHKTD